MKTGVNPEQKYRKEKKRQNYERAERERVKTRKELGKKLNVDKLRSRMEFIEKEEEAGRLTIGMRREKSEIAMQLKSISKKTPATDHAFQRKTPINETRNGVPKKPELKTPPPPPQEVKPVEAPAVNVPPPPPVAVYNPMARKAAPVHLGTLSINSSLIPTAVKLQTTKEVEKPQTNNPFAASLEAIQKPTVEEDVEASVPGPKLRFNLVPYGENESSDEVDEKGEDEFNQFMKEIATM